MIVRLHVPDADAMNRDLHALIFEEETRYPSLGCNVGGWHSRPDFLPGHPLSGVLEFLDPRAGVEAVTAPGDPYGEPFRVRPEPGLVVVFRAGSITGCIPTQAPRLASRCRSTRRWIGKTPPNTPSTRTKT